MYSKFNRKQMKRITQLLFILLVFTAFSCTDDDRAADNPSAQNPVTDAEFAKNFGAEVQRDFIGQIVDTDNHPVAGAQIKIGSSTAQTDANGVFVINGAGVYEKFAYITATKAGYITGSRSMVPTSGKNNVKIMLIPAQAIQTIASGATATVDMPNGTKVIFDGAFTDEAGNAYSGTVNVSMFHLEASNENLASLMPGMLYAKNNSGQPVGLETFGMLNVELRGSGGQKLQIASGHKADITMTIDNTKLATAPATIPLWHFDEVNGYWKEEGFAVRQGNKYIGQVSHFSWWNCDAPFETNYLTVIVKDGNGQLLKNIGVGVRTQSISSQAMGYTNSEGSVSGLVPANATLLVRIYDPCGNVVKETSIAAITQPAQTVIELETMDITTSLIKGKIVKCNGSNVTNGYVILEYGEQMFFSDVSNGNFQFPATVCNGENSFTVRAYDVDDFQTTGVISNTFDAGTTDLGILPVCSTVNEYIVFQVDDFAPTYIFEGIDTFAVPGSDPLTIRYTTGEHIFFSMAGSTTVPGIYTGSQFQIGLTNFEGWGYHSYNFHYTTTEMIEVEVLKYGNVGEYIDIRFRADGISGSGAPYLLNGYIHVLRD